MLDNAELSRDLHLMSSVLSYVQRTHLFHRDNPAGPCGGPIPSGIGFAPSANNFSSVFFLLYSITLLCWKYVTYVKPSQPASTSLKVALWKIYSFAERGNTQLAAQSFSSPFSSSPQHFFASSSFRMLSMMPFRSRHVKNASRAVQQARRALRSGAS